MTTRMRVTVVLLVVLGVHWASAQTPQKVEPSNYPIVMAIAFEVPRPEGWEKRVTLQYLYDQPNEAQIVITRQPDGHFQLDRWFLPAGSLTVSQQLVRMRAERPRPTDAEMAKRIGMRRESRVVEFTTPLGRVVDEAYTDLRIPFVRGAPFTHDSPVLRAEVWTAGTQLTIEMDEPADTSQIATPDNVLIAWMRRLRREVERSWADLPLTK